MHQKYLMLAPSLFVHFPVHQMLLIIPFSFPIRAAFSTFLFTLSTLSTKPQYPNALLLEFLLLLLSSHAAQESSIKLSPATLWSAGLIILVNAGLPVGPSLRGETCACTIRTASWLCRCVAQPIAPFGEYFQMV